MPDFGFPPDISMVVLWIVIAAILAIVETLTAGFVTIWFTIGAAVAAVVAAVGGNMAIQIIVFVVVSVVLLIFTRPILVQKLKVGREKNNIELIEGKVGLVTETIAPFKSGLVKVNGVIWTAVGDETEFAADAGSQVEIIRIEGVKLIVKNAPGSKQQ